MNRSPLIEITDDNSTVLRKGILKINTIDYPFFPGDQKLTCKTPIRGISDQHHIAVVMAGIFRHKAEASFCHLGGYRRNQALLQEAHPALDQLLLESREQKKLFWPQVLDQRTCREDFLPQVCSLKEKITRMSGGYDVFLVGAPLEPRLRDDYHDPDQGMAEELMTVTEGRHGVFMSWMSARHKRKNPTLNALGKKKDFHEAVGSLAYYYLYDRAWPERSTRRDFLEEQSSTMLRPGYHGC